jgi:hypothetical protein
MEGTREPGVPVICHAMMQIDRSITYPAFVNLQMPLLSNNGSNNRYELLEKIKPLLHRRIWSKGCKCKRFPPGCAYTSVPPNTRHRTATLERMLRHGCFITAEYRQ